MAILSTMAPDIPKIVSVIPDVHLSSFRRARLHHVRPLALLAAALCLLPLRFHAQGSAPTEYQVKAAFLYNFAKYIDWPEVAFGSKDAPFVIGVLGDDPFDGVLDRTLLGKEVKERKIILRRSQNPEELKTCQIIFVGKQTDGHLAATLEKLRSLPILTVGDKLGFIGRGGMIRLEMSGQTVRFKIDVTTAEACGLKVSSQLLRLEKATVIRDGKEVPKK